MKKIMFNDKYGLTKAVLEGKKTQTRRIVSQTILDKREKETIKCDFSFRAHSHYKIGDIVAIAQNYKDAGFEPDMLQEAIIDGNIGDYPISMLPGWKNKMFVYPDMMPHRLLITNVRVQYLQNIKDEDCIEEGIFDEEWNKGDENLILYGYPNMKDDKRFHSPKDAFAELIDKTTKRGTWRANPLVYVYDFELTD